MRFVGLINGVEEAGHPIQSLNQHKTGIMEWARLTAKKNPNQTVQVYEMVPKLVATVTVHKTVEDNKTVLTEDIQEFKAE